MFFDLVELNLIIEVPTLFRENAERRFDGSFCGTFVEVAAAIWLEERKSENEDTVCGTGRVVCPESVGGISRGLPASEELGGLSTRASTQRSQDIPSSQRTNYVLLLLLDPLVIRRKAVPHGGIDCVHWGQTATELFSRFSLVHAALSITKVIPAGIRVVTGTCEANRQAMGVLNKGWITQYAGEDEGLQCQGQSNGEAWLSRWISKRGNVGGIAASTYALGVSYIAYEI